MEFFDRKEEVLDVQLTQYGKYLLSVGKLKPAYYSFFDDDVNYDTEYQGDPPAPGNTPGPSENQKDTVDRIKETPRIKVVHSIDSVEDSVNQIAEFIPEVDLFNDFSAFGQNQLTAIADQNVNISGIIQPGLVLGDEGTSDPQDFGTLVVAVPEGLSPSGMPEGDSLIVNSLGQFNALDYLSPMYGNIPYKYPKPQRQSLQGYIMPLGTSDYNSKYYPAFDMKFMKGEMNQSIYYDSNRMYGIARIPQIEIEVTYETTLGSSTETPGLEIISVKGSDESPEHQYGFISGDGTYVAIEEDYIVINLKELNSLNLKENFDIEVYVIEQYGTTKERLKPLRFGGSSFINENINIISDPNNFNMIVGEGFVEYYFNVSVDEEINMVTKEEDMKNIYGTSGFAGKVIDSLPSQGADICEDEL